MEPESQTLACWGNPSCSILTLVIVQMPVRQFKEIIIWVCGGVGVGVGRGRGISRMPRDKERGISTLWNGSISFLPEQFSTSNFLSWNLLPFRDAAGSKYCSATNSSLEFTLSLHAFILLTARVMPLCLRARSGLQVLSAYERGRVKTPENSVMINESRCWNIPAPLTLRQNNSEAHVLLWLSELRELSSSCPQ